MACRHKKLWRPKTPMTEPQQTKGWGRCRKFHSPSQMAVLEETTNQQLIRMMIHPTPRLTRQ
jgi:hypothetical protein